jgi:hypothetical protein
MLFLILTIFRMICPKCLRRMFGHSSTTFDDYHQKDCIILETKDLRITGSKSWLMIVFIHAAGKALSYNKIISSRIQSITRPTKLGKDRRRNWKERNKKHFLPCRELTPARRQIPFDLVSMIIFLILSHSPPS